MARTTSIAWTERTWNPIVGCSRLSPGCTPCFAIPIAHRLGRIGSTAEKYRGVTTLSQSGFVYWTGKLNFWEPDLDKPLKWPRSMIFVNSMSDIAHEDMPVDWFARIIDVMVRARQERGHVFQCLTKRPENLAKLLDAVGVRAPLEGVWWGISAEDTRRWDERVPILLGGGIPNCLPWVSVEPQHEQINRDPISLGWIVIGGESDAGRIGAKRFELDWARTMIARCQAQGVPVFMKQVGSNAVDRGELFPTSHPKGEDPGEWPEDLRIRQYPVH